MAIAVGVNSKGTTGGGTSVTSTGVTTQASGSVIVLCVISADATAITIPADSKGNSYTAIAGATGLFAGPNKKIWFFYKENATGGASHTATANASPSDAITLLFQEITGALTASALDTAVTNYANDVSSPFTVTGGTQGQANELLITGFSGNVATNAASTVGGSFTKTAEEQNGASFYDGAIAWLVTAATTATTPSWTRATATDTGVSIIGFKESSSTAVVIGANRTILDLKNPKKRFKVATRSTTGSDVTVALTGKALVFSAGTLVPSTSVPLVGTQYAWSAGTLTPSKSVAMTGTAVAFAAGTLTPSTDVPLAGSLVTFSTGTITASSASGDVTLALTGQAMSFGAGTLTPSSTVLLTGSAEAYSTGTIAVDHSQALTGIAEVYGTGVLTPSTTISLLGSLVSYSAGTMSAQAGGDITVALSGASFAFATDTLIASGADAASSVTPAGGSRTRTKLRRRKHIIRIEGRIFEAEDESQAIAILAQAQVLAEKAAKIRADEIVERALPKAISLGAVKPIAIKAPTIQVSDALQAQAEITQAAIDRAYASASAAAELRLLLALMEAEDDEDEELWLLN